MRGHLVADGYDGLRDHVARLARFEWVDGRRDARRRRASPRCRSPAARCRCCRPRRSTPARRSARIEKKRAGLVQEIERAEKKLANEQFVAKAPAEVVDEERRKLAEYREALRS